MEMIRYAGWDPSEHVRSISNRINAKRARELRNEGLTWVEVAARLSAEANRDPPFTGEAVRKVAARYK